MEVIMVKKYISLLLVAWLQYASVQAMLPAEQFPADTTLPQKKAFLRNLVPPCPIANNAKEVTVLAALANWNAINRPQAGMPAVVLDYVLVDEPLVDDQIVDAGILPMQVPAVNPVVNPVGFFERLNKYEIATLVVSMMACYNIAVALDQETGFCLFTQGDERVICKISAQYSDNKTVQADFIKLLVAGTVVGYFAKKLFLGR